MANVLNILDKTRKGGSETLVELDDSKRTKVWRPTESLSGGTPSAGSAPSLNFETPAGDISQPSQTAQFLPQFTSALQLAMDEAGKHRQANLIGLSLSGVAGGKALGPNTVPGIVDMVRRSVGPEVSAVFGGGTQAVSAQIKAEQEERNFQLRLREQNINLLSGLAEDGVLMDMPDGALISMARSAGLSDGAALAWKARLTSAKKESDQKYNLELQKLQAEIEETKANTQRLLRPPKSGDGTSPTEQAATGDLFSSIMQEAIDNGASPEQAALEATQYADAIGYQIDEKGSASLLAKARTLTPLGQPEVEAPADTGGGQPSVRTTLLNTGINIAGSIAESEVERRTAPIREVTDKAKDKAIELGIRGVINGIGAFFGD